MDSKRVPATLLLLASLSYCFGTSKVSLDVLPRANLFEGGFFVLKCAPQDGSTDWTVYRNTTKHRATQICGQGWGRHHPNSCKVGLAVTWDTGLYWCQSPGGTVSNNVNVRVTSGSLLVKLPFLPVYVGDDVTLSCVDRNFNNKAAHFFKDDLRLTSEPRLDLRLGAVNWSDQGSFRCSTEDVQSAPALLQVHNRSRTEPINPVESGSAHMHLVLRLLCHLLVACPYCVSTVLMVSLYRRRTNEGERPRRRVKREECEEAVTTSYHF